MTNLWPILYHFAIGFLMAFIGLMSPGMLTISTLNAAIDRGPKSAMKFAIGAVLPIIIQAHLALLGANYIKEHPQILNDFSKIAVFVFFILAFVFFKQYRQRKVIIKTPKFSINSSFWYGVFISTINPLAIPFYFTYSTLLELQGLLTIKQPFISAFVTGAVLGAFTIMYIYGKNAHILMSKLQFVGKNFKLILTLIMFILGLGSLMHVLKVY